jgi:hypothetical protein
MGTHILMAYIKIPMLITPFIGSHKRTQNTHMPLEGNAKE